MIWDGIRDQVGRQVRKKERQKAQLSQTKSVQKGVVKISEGQGKGNKQTGKIGVFADKGR